MKKLLLSLTLLGSLSGFSQITIFEDSFESYDDFTINNFGGWNGLDLDLLNTYTGGQEEGAEPWLNAGDPQAFMIFNPVAAAVTNSTDACSGTLENRNFDPHTGSKFAGCWAGVPDSNGQTGTGANNDWLISPPIELGTADNVLRFWVKNLSSCYGNERYKVGIYVGTGTPQSGSDFTYIAGNPLAFSATTSWVERVVNVNSTYNGQTVRFGIQCTSADAYLLLVDDFKVTATALSINDVFSSKFEMYPNPANSIVSISNSDSILVNNVSLTDLNGRTIKNVNLNGVSSAEINVSDLASGIYFMNINTDQGIATKKFVKN